METLTQDFTYQIDYTHTQSLSLSLSLSLQNYPRYGLLKQIMVVSGLWN